jgi:hypothetical protein
MSDSIPPPSWPRDADRVRIGRALGTLRDGVGSLRNLEQLLSSIKVGPRSIAGVIPDVVASCEPLRESLTDLSGTIVVRLPSTEGALDALGRHAGPQIDELSLALLEARRRDVNAASRLQLQQVVKTVVRDLECVVELVALLGEAVWTRPVVLGVGELVSEAFRATEPGIAQTRGTVRLTVSCTAVSMEFATRPNAVVGLVGHALRWLVEGDEQATAHVEISCPSDHEVRFTMQLGAHGTDYRYVSGRHVVPATAPCLDTVASVLGGGLQLQTEPRRVVITLGVVASC